MKTFPFKLCVEKTSDENKVRAWKVENRLQKFKELKTDLILKFMTFSLVAFYFDSLNLLALWRENC